MWLEGGVTHVPWCPAFVSLSLRYVVRRTVARQDHHSPPLPIGGHVEERGTCRSGISPYLSPAEQHTWFDVGAPRTVRIVGSRLEATIIPQRNIARCSVEMSALINSAIDRHGTRIEVA
jgi:hypothetical protein